MEWDLGPRLIYINYKQLCILGFKVDLAVVRASSVFNQDNENWGPEQALTEISTNNKSYWHSATGDNNPSITFKMQQDHEVLFVEVVDRQDCCHERFNNVEVRIGSTLLFGDAQSCGVQSYEGNTTYKFAMRFLRAANNFSLIDMFATWVDNISSFKKRAPNTCMSTMSR